MRTPRARGLRLVRRADAAPRRADRLAALRAAVLAQAVEQLVVRQDHVRAEPDQQLVAHEQAARLAVRDLLEQRVRIDHHAVAEHAALAGVADARRHEVRDELLAVDHERVAGVRAAAVAHDGVGALGEQVDDLALAFVAPLGADDDRRRTSILLEQRDQSMRPHRCPPSGAHHQHGRARCARARSRHRARRRAASSRSARPPWSPRAARGHAAAVRARPRRAPCTATPGGPAGAGDAEARAAPGRAPRDRSRSRSRARRGRSARSARRSGRRAAPPRARRPRSPRTARRCSSRSRADRRDRS